VIRSIVALISGFAIYVFAVFVLTLPAAFAFGARGGTPTPSLVVAGLAIAAVSALVGGYACAALAPMKPGAHVAGLAAMVLVSHLSALFKPPQGVPRWDPAALAGIAPLLTLAGGVLRRPRTSTVQP
jgi:hypothetical protein